MADFTINANDFGAFYQNVGQNGTNDTVTVNIGTGFEGTISVDSVPGDDEIETIIINIPEGWKLQIDAIEQEGEGVAYKSYSFEVINADGEAVGTLAMRGNVFEGVPCFCSGTMIETPHGYRAVEDLNAGDLVITADNGPKPIKWAGVKTLSQVDLLMVPELLPIRIKAGALGKSVPAQDLLVSPQHRILVRSRVAQKMFGANEVLVAAKQLLQLDGIDVETGAQQVKYYHFLFDQHEIVFANGTETESLFTGKEALKSVGKTAQEEIFQLFPELRSADADACPSARPLPSGRMARKLAVRHAQNNQPLVQ